MALLGHVSVSQIANRHARKIPHLKKKKQIKKESSMEIHLGKTKLNQKLTWKSTHVKYFILRSSQRGRNWKERRSRKLLGKRDQNIRPRKQNAASLDNFSALCCYLLGLLLILEYRKFHQYAFYALNIISITLLYSSGFQSSVVAKTKIIDAVSSENI